MKDSPQSSSPEMPPVPGGDLDTAKPRLLAENTEEESGETEQGSTDTLDNDSPGPKWLGYLFASLPVFACLFGAGREVWSKGIITVLLALLLILFASKRKLPRIVCACFAAVLSAPLLAFLPAAWLPFPAWKKTLIEDWELPLSGTVTPQAAVTLETWLLFALCVLWLAWCVTRACSERQRRAIIHTLTLGGTLLCLLSILEGVKWISIFWWPRNPPEWGEGFGPFANRNHISSLAAMTSVLCAAAAYDAHRRKSRLWLLFVICFLVPLTCIFMNSSRAGLVLFFLGLTTWFGTSAMRRGFFQKLAVSTSLIFIISTLLVMSGGNVSKRLTEEGLANFASSQGRLAIFADCLKMTLDSPWTGVGLGNFDATFPQFSTIHNALSFYLHPESDLLWLLVEGGLLTLLPGALILVWIFKSTGPWFGKKTSKSSMQDRRLRNVAAIAFGLGAMHGLVDVPSHGLGYALFMAMLAGVSVRPRRLPEVSGMGQRVAFRVCGLAVLALGIAWVAVALGHPVLPGSSAAEMLRGRADKLVSSGSPRDALPLLNAAIQMKPMDYRLYFERARVRLMLGQPDEDALTDFTRSRLLAPQIARPSLAEGMIWLDYNPTMAVVPWREVLRRWPEYNYWFMLQAGDQHPELREPLWSLATTTSMKLQYLAHRTSREEFERCLRSLLAQHSNLENLESAQRETLFNLWYDRGDRPALISALESNRKWRDDGWRLLAEHYARNSEFQKACQTALPYLPSIIRTIPGTSSDIPTLERALLYNPTDPRRGIDLFQAQKKQGDIDGALRTLEKVAALPKPPPFVHQEIAALHMARQDFRRAWEHLREAMQKR